jgi:hypothetical protein
MGNEREEKVRARAHEIWEREGQVSGLEREHWERAGREIDAEDNEGKSVGAGDDGLSTVDDSQSPESSPGDDHSGLTRGGDPKARRR